MQLLTEFMRRVAMFVRGERFKQDLRDEIRLHLELREEQHREGGLPPDRARAMARRTFGNELSLREASEDLWGWRWFEYFLRDLRFGARALAAKPGFTVIAILALGLGTGATSAIFSVVNSVLLRPLSYKDADRLVTVLHEPSDPVAPANYIDWRAQSRSFTDMAAAEAWSPNLEGGASVEGSAVEHLTGLHVTENLLPMLGVGALAGRATFTSPREVILSYRLWQRRFAGDPHILGRSIGLSREAYTVVGVMPPDFKFAPFWATRAELWSPLEFGERLHDRGGNSLRVFARLKDGTSLSQARADISTITARLEAQYPGSNRHVIVTPLKENVVGKVERPLLVMLFAVAFVLLISCANVAHMLMARTSGRQREIAVRTALGAGRRRVLAQFLTENLLLAAMGAALGLLLAFGGVRVLVALSPAAIPRLDAIRVDRTVLEFLLAMTVLTSFAFGIVPAVKAASADLSGALKEGDRGGSDGAERSGFRGILVASEFALAFVLLTGAGLMIRTFIALQSVNPGFNPRGVLSMEVSVAGTQESAPERRAIFYRQLLDRVRATPGVIMAGYINHLPLAGDMWGRSFSIEGRPAARPGEAPNAVYRAISPGYLATMRLPLRAGRDILNTDDDRAPLVTLINERAARIYWPGENAIGKRIALDKDAAGTPLWMTVVGVVADAKQLDWAAPIPYPEIYIALLQSSDFLANQKPHYAYVTLVARTASNPAALTSALKQAVWSFDRNIPVSAAITMEEAVAQATAEPRFEMFLLIVFAGVALVLAASGIYGVLSYSVSRRIREIGIRMSVGASRGEVLRLILGRALRQALVGGAMGAAAAFFLARLMSGMLYEVRPADPVTLIGVAASLLAAALLAGFLPARKATRIEPVIALRNE